MSLQEGIKFVLCVGNGIGFHGEKVLCLDVHVDLQSNNYCLVTSGMELPHGLPHAEPVAALHGFHQHLPSLGQSSDAQTEQDQPPPATEAAVPESSPHKPEATDSLVRLCCLYFFPYLNLSSNHLSKMAWPWKAVCPPNINHYRIILCLCFIISDFTQEKITPPYLGKSPLTLLLPLGNILVHSLVLHPRPKAKLCLPIPLVTSHLSANHVPWGRAELWGVTSALFSCVPKWLQMVTAAKKLKTLAPWRKSYDKPRQHITK